MKPAFEVSEKSKQAEINRYLFISKGNANK